MVAAIAYHFFPRSSLFSNAQENSSIELEVIDKEIDNEPSSPGYDRTDERNSDSFFSFTLHLFIDPSKYIHQSTDEDDPEADISDKREEIIGDSDDDSRDFAEGDISLTEVCIVHAIPIFILKNWPLSVNPWSACHCPEKEYTD